MPRSHNITDMVHEPGVIPGTQFGPNLLTMITTAYYNGSTLQGIAYTMKMYDAGSCKAAIQHTMEAASEKMEKEVGKIREDLAKS